MDSSAIATRLFETVIQGLDPNSVGAPREALEEFARKLLNRAPAELFKNRAAERIAEDVQALYQMADEAPPDEVAVRITRLPDRAHRAAIATVMPDCPFIVDTLREHVHAEGFGIVHLLHPVFVLDRDNEGHILQVRERTAAAPKTSVVYLVMDGHIDDEQMRALEIEVRSRLKMVVTATSGFGQMLERCRDLIADMEESKKRQPWRGAEFEELQELLTWLQDGCFVFLGYRAYELVTDDSGQRAIRVEPGSGLGILADAGQSRYQEVTPLSELPSDLRGRILGGPLLIVSKSNALSPVHRRARMDDISIKKIGADGEVLGERRFLGLFTAKAFAEDASNIPILRRKLREILEAEQVDKGSHDYGLIVRIFNSLPKEDLFLASVPELLRVVDTVVESEAVDEVMAFSRPDALGRGVNVMVILPKHKFSGEVRQHIQDTLIESYDGTVLNYHLALGEGDQARLHFYLAADLKSIDAVNVEELQSRVREAVRTWEERLRGALERRHDVERAHQLTDLYHHGFSAEYMAAMTVEEAADDVLRLDALASTGMQQVVLAELPEPRPHAAQLKIFARRGQFVLSDVMPILENLGFRVIEADAYLFGQAGSDEGSTIHTFVVETPADWRVDLRDAVSRVAAAFRGIWNGQAANDSLNSLVLSARLTWREVALLRAYAGYAFHIGAVASRLGVSRPLTEHPKLAGLLYRIFAALHDPGASEDRERVVEGLIAEFHEALDAVRSIEDDRTHRRLLNLVSSTARSNFFQARARERSPGLIALKFRCSQIEVMPSPRPKFEVYVMSAATEAAHLRMDDVARGGIRWSDRTGDFRVEVLGLVKTQQVKNALIVPAGAKGAFVMLDPPAEREEWLAAGVESYREFIRGLLDLTDNLSDTGVKHPPDIVVRDGDDPYLVVAADKGTARLSDTANALALEYDFWLGDAFASGGSHGYDHKEFGITARGAWESVKRHFRELGHHIQEEEFTAVGVGDMSGDVFGNGMLLSRNTRLVAAFDHRHVFLDPDPDAERSWEERKRLYDLPRSSWADYDPSLISEGGGVFERGSKRIELSEQVREVLDIDDEALNGEALVRCILGARVDLLWSGGIGTYVKSSRETHGEVGDHGNDAVRIDATELRARVVGEGGNLGMTQRARVEYALAGGRLNTDALDNSAGVNMSDHEVNLKILLNAGVRQGSLDPDGRNGLLREVAGDVIRAVISDNYWQSLAVSLDEHRAVSLPAEFREAISTLERAGILDRSLEFLPTGEEMIERQELGQFLTRPELADLLAHAQMHLKRAIVGSEMVEDEAFLDLARAYFPARAMEVAGEELLRGHWLRHRIAGTVLANLLATRMGATGHLQLARESGRPVSEVARAWYIAYRIGGAECLYDGIQSLDDDVAAGVQAQWFLSIADELGRATRWLLANPHPEMSIAETVEWFRKPVEALRDQLSDLLAPHERVALDDRVRMYRTDGMEEGPACELATFTHLADLLPIAQLARQSGVEAARVGGVYFGLTREIDFPWLQEQVTAATGADLWDRHAAKTLSLQFEAARARMTAAILESTEPDSDVETCLASFRRSYGADLRRVWEVVGDLRATETPSLTALMVVAHEVADCGLRSE